MNYCVIFYVGNFWTPNFGLISVQSLLYSPISLLFTPKNFLRLPPQNVSVNVPGAQAQCENEGGREGSYGWRKIVRGCA